MAGRAGRILPTYRNHYSILVTYVKDYFKWFVCCGIAGRPLECDVERRVTMVFSALAYEGRQKSHT